MRPDPVLNKAAQLCKKGRYGDAIHLLEPEVVRYHDSFRFYYILASSCLYAKDFGGAHTYLRRAKEIKMRDPGVLMGLAVLHLRRRETDRAIDLYLEVLEKEPDNRIAKRGLNVIRKYGDPEVLNSWLESGRLVSLYPQKPKPMLSRSTITFRAILFSVSILLLLGIAYTALFHPLSNNGDSGREGLALALLEADEKAAPVQVGGSYRYILSRSDVIDIFEQAGRLFSDYRDEAAKVHLNKLLESNASEAVKNKSKLLLSYTAVPGFNTLKDFYSYSEVLAEPVLYRDVHVVWRGMAANVQNQEKSTSFELLVGYDTRNNLEGIVRVQVPFAVSIDPERPLEVLGRVIPAGTGSNHPIPIHLEAVAIHQSAKLEEPR